MGVHCSVINQITKVICHIYVEHTIDAGTATPVRKPPYQVSYAYREMVEAELKEMLDSGIIEPSASQWSAPIVFVKKKMGP